ncbi:hypothetical protein [Methylomonas koyamae]|uniref:hypothetical protein n=1 Tax=Methylomonas koyamae TaxID=702114 RepID=UPI000A693DCB|nr:hypothetical protein [Methylomonas koyamae]
MFWVSETAHWEAIRAAAKQANIGKQIDDALAIIETENPKLKGIPDKRYPPRWTNGCRRITWRVL